MATEFIMRNVYPEIMNQVFPSYPTENQRVEVLYYNHSTNDNIWFLNGKFVNYIGSEMHGIIGWKNYTIK